jgi:hypothetical protein
MIPEELRNVLGLHKKWLNDEDGGTRADLCRADLCRADLCGADLRGANLREADLREAHIDFSCWPLWCGSKNVKVDKKIFAQLAMHLCGVIVDDDECKQAQAALMPIARQCHRADEFLAEEITVVSAA